MMYSNFLNTNKKTSILRYKPPGFDYPIDIPFPGRVLPVCARCKRNYKTREHCRIKEGHNNLPWTDTYICITFDPSCFVVSSDSHGNAHPTQELHRGPFYVQGVQSQPYIYPDTKILDPKTPSCAQCKDKNYTRTYCRTSKKHKTLPWSTVYVVLSLRTDGQGMSPEDMVSSPHPSSKKRRKTNSGRAAKAESSPSKSVSGDSAKEAGAAKEVKTESADADAEPTTTTTAAAGDNIKVDEDAKPENATVATTESTVTKTESEEPKIKEDEDKDEKAASDDAATPAAADAANGDDKTTGETAAAATKEEEGQGEDKDKNKDKDKSSDQATEPIANIFKDVHSSRTFLSTVSVDRNDAEWVDLDQNQLTLLQHRQKQEQLEHEQAYSQSHYPQMSQMMAPNGMHGMGMNMHSAMGHFPGMPSGAPGGTKDDSNRPPGMPSGHMDPNQWGGMGNGANGRPGPGGPGGGTGGPGNPHMPNPQFPMPQDMMYNAAQMMDPRMAGSYGFQSWHPNQRHGMDMQGMQGGGPQYGQMGQMPYDGHMMQMPWGGSPPVGGQMGPQDMGGPQGGGNGGGGMQGQGMPPQGMSPHSGHPGMPPHQNMMSPHPGMPSHQNMPPQGGMPYPGGMMNQQAMFPQGGMGGGMHQPQGQQQGRPSSQAHSPSVGGGDGIAGENKTNGPIDAGSNNNGGGGGNKPVDVDQHEGQRDAEKGDLSE